MKEKTATVREYNKTGFHICENAQFWAFYFCKIGSFFARPHNYNYINIEKAFKSSIKKFIFN